MYSIIEFAQYSRKLKIIENQIRIGINLLRNYNIPSCFILFSQNRYRRRKLLFSMSI